MSEMSILNAQAMTLNYSAPNESVERDSIKTPDYYNIIITVRLSPYAVSYLSVAQWHESQQQPKHYFRRWGMQRTYDTNKTLWYVTSAYLTH